MGPILEDGRISIHRSPTSRSRSWSYSTIADEKAGLASNESFLANGIIEDDLPWQKLLARFLFLSGLAPCLLTVWASRIQLSALATLIVEQGLPMWRVALLCWVVLFDVISSIDGIFVALLTLPLLFSRWRLRLRLLGSNVPSVDVIITVCNEKLDIIQDTVRAALHIDYPQHRFRVIISDDGANPSLRDWVEQQQNLGTPNLHYTTRIKSGGARATGYKAGNLNHAMSVAYHLPGGRAEYVAGLDADMIPERQWLRAVAAHIVRDRKTGMRRQNWLCLDVVRDRVGAGWNLGSGWIVRRDAIDDIGGFPTNCLVEDVFSSMLMLANRWKTAYVREALQYGLVPETYLGYVKQFTRCACRPPSAAWGSPTAPSSTSSPSSPRSTSSSRR
ncbi:nucleotide-diphospho-sugar transferase [Lasiosphaeria ovina]|uniref:Nucleotide-diphospho-sugar transferase n=1 Tax=Lasiosphaeria ovina TaxID=92902 RepID=A0AAE0KB92_9PEZI|nr:nucleotide-diphospho-sugar transferase [Lasiosphaeria ovina]